MDVSKFKQNPGKPANGNPGNPKERLPSQDPTPKGPGDNNRAQAPKQTVHKAFQSYHTAAYGEFPEGPFNIHTGRFHY